MTASDIIRQYYKDADATTRIKDRRFCVDTDAVQRVTDIFDNSPTTAYKRDDITHTGFQSICDFFTNKRSLWGAHKVEDKDITETTDASSGETIVNAAGNFCGHFFRTAPTQDQAQRQIISAQAVRLNFIDVWKLRDGKVTLRESHISPAVNHSRTGCGIVY